MSELQYKNVCITGTLALMTREDAVGAIEKAGGYFNKTVSSYTHFLVTAEKPGAVKLKQAKKFGTKILTEKQFLNILKKDTPNLDLHDPSQKTKDELAVTPTDMKLQSRDW